MSDDFIERLRREAREAAEKAKQPKELEPWVIERQKEDEQRKRNRVLGMQYFKESGCQACCEKLAAFLNSQDPQAKASFSEGYNYGYWSIAYQVEFIWHAKVYVKGVHFSGSIHGTDDRFEEREIRFAINVKPDWSLVFEHRDLSRETVSLNQWRANKQAVENAFERAYRNAPNHRI